MQLAGFYCFLFALVLSVVCLALSFTLTTSPYYKHHSSLDRRRESEVGENINLLSFISVTCNILQLNRVPMRVMEFCTSGDFVQGYSFSSTCSHTLIAFGNFSFFQDRVSNESFSYSSNSVTVSNRQTPCFTSVMFFIIIF